MTLLNQCDFLAVVIEEEMDDEATSFKGNLSSLVLQGYWAFQVGLLTPLTFARHHLSLLLLLLPMHTFFTIEGGDNKFANFTLPTLRHFWRPVVRMCLATSNNLLRVL